MSRLTLVALWLTLCGFTGTASYYTEASCKKEGTSGIMANGRRLDDEAFTAASWDYPFGTRLRITSGRRTVDVEVTDRGPARRLYSQGRIIDLSQKAFAALASIEKGVIQVSVEALP